MAEILRKHIQAIFLNRDKIALTSVCDLYAERPGISGFIFGFDRRR